MLNSFFVTWDIRGRGEVFLLDNGVSDSLSVGFGLQFAPLSKKSVKNGVELLDGGIIVLRVQGQFAHFLFCFLLVILFLEC